MIKVYVTSHICSFNQVRERRYWVADDTISKIIHIGVSDADKSWLSLLISSLESELIELDIPDEGFKALMLAEGYAQ